MASSLMSQLEADLKSKQVQQQALRVARLFVIAFGAQLALTGTSDLGWKALAGAAVAAVEAVVRQVAPVAPVAQARAAFLRHMVREEPGAVPAAAPAPAPGVSPAGPPTVPPSESSPSA